MKLLTMLSAAEINRRQKIGDARRKLFAEGKLKTTKGRVTRKNLAWSAESKRKISQTRKRMYAEGELSRRSPNKILVIPKLDLDTEFGNWFAGFSDGESCFSVAKRSGHSNVYVGSLQPIFKITLRRDDVDVLFEIQKQLGFGSIGYGKMIAMQKGKLRTTLTVSFTVVACAHCMALVQVFSRFKLRAKKRNDFDVWKQLVQICYEQDGAKYADHHVLVDALQTGKKFKRQLLIPRMV
jgi:hypothetical protein